MGQEASYLGQKGITTRGESVQPLQSVKLIYQLCSRSRAAWTSSGLDGSGWLAWMESKCWLLGWNPSVVWLGWDPSVVLVVLRGEGGYHIVNRC